MGVLRSSRGCIEAGGSWILPAGVVFLLAGCVPGPLVRSGSDSCSCPASIMEGPETSVDQPGSEHAAEKPTKPRTLPQAACAYLHCLRTHAWETPDQEEHGNEEKKGNKNQKNSHESDKSSEAP